MYLLFYCKINQEADVKHDLLSLPFSRTQKMLVFPIVFECFTAGDQRVTPGWTKYRDIKFTKLFYYSKDIPTDSRGKIIYKIWILNMLKYGEKYISALIATEMNAYYHK